MTVQYMILDLDLGLFPIEIIIALGGAGRHSPHNMRQKGALVAAERLGGGGGGVI